MLHMPRGLVLELMVWILPFYLFNFTSHLFVHRRCGDSRSSACTINILFTLPLAGQREELYSLKGATVPYLAHPDIQLLLINNTSSKILALST